MTEEEYKRAIAERDEWIDSLFISIQSMRENRNPEFSLLLERAVKERNELDLQRASLQAQFDAIYKENIKFKKILEHIDIRDIGESLIEGTQKGRTKVYIHNCHLCGVKVLKNVSKGNVVCYDCAYARKLESARKSIIHKRLSTQEEKGVEL